MTEVDDEQLLKRGPSATLLLKMLNANNPAVDKMNLRKADLMYGKADLLAPVPYAQAVVGGGPFGDSKKVAAAAT